MKKDTVSVIVPVYNAADRLELCVSSLLNQTYKSIEIVLVNDASKDDSDSICQKYSQNKDIFKYIKHELNQGQTITRNDGIRAAEGQWMLFLDADDTLEKDALAILVETAKRDNTDMVVSDYKTIDDKGNEKIFSSSLEKGKYTTESFVANLFSSYTSAFLSCIGTKLYRMEFVKNVKPETPNSIATNYDMAFILDALSAKPSISYIKKVTYVYYQNAASISHTYRKNMYQGFTAARVKMLPLLKTCGCYEDKKLDYFLVRYSTIMWSLSQEIEFSKGYHHFKDVYCTICDDVSTSEMVKVIESDDPKMSHRIIAKLFKSRKYSILTYLFFYLFIRKH